MAFQPQNKSWICEDCTFKNSASSKTCIMCETPDSYECKVRQEVKNKHFKILDRQREKEIEKDYKIIARFTNKLKKRDPSECVRMVRLSMNKLEEGAMLVLEQELKKIHVPEGRREMLKNELKNKIEVAETVEITVDFSTQMDTELNYNWGGKSHIGVFVLGLAPSSNSNDKIILVCAGHYETWECFENRRLRKGHPTFDKQKIINFLTHQLWKAAKYQLYIS
eukprot:50686_1